MNFCTNKGVRGFEQITESVKKLIRREVLPNNLRDYRLQLYLARESPNKQTEELEIKYLNDELWGKSNRMNKGYFI